MAEGNTKIILDSNIWVSFAIGKQLERLKDVLYNPGIDIFVCDEIITEFNRVIKRPKFKKYAKPGRIKDINEIILLTTINKNYVSKVKASRDKNDNYLLSLAKDTKADYLVTGDKDLLVLKKFGHTMIVTFTQFLTFSK
jgi:putative PIN family toxin of toxin-antitoxin system